MALGAGDLGAFTAALQSRFESEDARLLARRFVHKLAMLDPQHIDVDSMAGAIRAIRDAAAVRRPGEALVRVHSDAAGSYVLVVSDDMSFLVDSVTIAIATSGRAVQSMLHPQLVVVRNADGTFSQLLDLWVDEALPTGALAESWMVIRLQQPVAPPDQAKVEALIHHVLDDVRMANTDWHQMTARVQQILHSLRQSPPAHAPEDESSEAADLLEWLLADHFTFLGYREYEIVNTSAGRVVLPIAATGLGILRLSADDVTSHERRIDEMPAAVRESTLEPRILVISKSSARSTVHRNGYLDHIGIKTFDAQGRVNGELRIMGLFTSEAYSASVREVPVVRKRVQAVMDALDLVPDSHSARDLLQFLEMYPRDELFQTRTPELLQVAGASAQLRALRQTRLFVRRDEYGRFVSCIVYLPRDRYNTAVRQSLDALLRQAFNGTGSEYTALVTESLLARVHFLIQIRADAPVSDVDIAALERRLADAATPWEDRWAESVIARFEEDTAREIIDDFREAFPAAYIEDFDVDEGVEDAASLHALNPGGIDLRWRDDPQRTDCVQFKVNRIGDEIAVSRLLPIMQHLDMDVIAERPYGVERRSGIAWVLDFDVQFLDGDLPDRNSLPNRASEAFRAVWTGECEDDRYNALVLRAGLTWQQAAVLRAYGHYLKQLGSSYGQGFMQSVLTGNASISRALVDLFAVKFDPTFVGDRARAERDLDNRIQHELDSVQSLDQDRVLRSFLGVIRATLRTNAYVRSDRARKPLSFKLDTRSIADAPLPRPKYEVWICSPRVEGVHLRFGDVARGGLRWSDRTEDFRTEVLGLVKAQEVKNAVIVPVGAKGGFVPAQLPDPASDRVAWMAEGQAAYREYLSGLLDITDNLVGGNVVPPRDVVRVDGDDPYLVVAADKGTATFSDLANSVAHDYGFWLDDAFASGGSVGYDHKAMGITARGAWESVQRHFRELGIDTQRTEFTAVGIGDMSGDVFGNGMLLSPHLRLIAAFDHRDIFIDPNPDAAAGFAERQRLFALPRSSWADYDTSKLSAGGAVYSRSSKSITPSPEARAALGIGDEQESFSPAELIRAILRAPVDLLWNGGIGTYVKAVTQSHADVGDKANDAIRVDGAELRCKVVGEGGNLGCTQAGRIEAARAGIKINTDAIDNSAGVDTSDHEVNIKILLQPLLESGGLDRDTRSELLASMTDDVARLVLADNYAQNLVLGVARSEAGRMVSVDRRLIADLERRGILDRGLEYLPNDRELAARQAVGDGLVSPEYCVLLAYAKIALVRALAEERLADDPWYSVMLRRYFPAAVANRYPNLLDSHPLRAQIIETSACNQVLNIGGVNFVFRAMEETNATAGDVVKAATIAIEVFDLQRVWDSINGLDNAVPASEQYRLHLEMRRLFDRATRWILQRYGADIDVAGLIARLQPVVNRWAPDVVTHMRGVELENLLALRDRHVAAGVPEPIATEVTRLLDSFTVLDIDRIATTVDEAADTLLPLYYAVNDRYQVDPALTRITDLPRDSRWDTLARLALRSDLYAATASIVESIARSTSASMSPDDRVDAWEARKTGAIARAKATLSEILAQESPTLASMSVLLRVMRNLAA